VPLTFAVQTVNAANEISVNTHEGELSPSGSGNYSPGNIVTYSEGESINYRFTITSSSAASGTMQVEFSQQDSNCLFFDESFSLGQIDSVSGSSPTVETNGGLSIEGQNLSSGFDWVQKLDVSFSGSGTAVVNYTLTLSNEAGNCGGSSTHTTLANASPKGGFANISNRTVPMPAGNILILPSITINKSVTSSTALPEDFTFTVAPAINGQTEFEIASGESSVFIDNVDPSQNYTITESGPSGHTFTGGTGSNCNTVQDSVGTPDGQMFVSGIESGRPAVDAVCNFTNTEEVGSITIEKDAVPNNLTDIGFTTSGSGVDDFTLDDDAGVDNADDTYGNEKTFSGLSAGTYTFMEDEVMGWDLTEITCNQEASVQRDVDARTLSITLSSGEDVACKFRNEQHGQVVVNKITDPANDTTAFPIVLNTDDGIDYSDPTPTTVATDAPATFIVGHGSYSVSEQNVIGWREVTNNCDDLTINGNTPLVDGVPTVSCTITNQMLASLTIKKEALPVDNQTFGFTTNNLTPATFGLSDNDNDPAQSSRTFSNLMPGDTFTVAEDSVTGWELTDLSCDDDAATATLGDRMISYTPNAGDDVTCTFTNTQLLSIGGIKYLWSENGIPQQTADSPWTIELFIYDEDEEDFVYRSDTTTDSDDGSYSFSDLLPGIYQLRELLSELDGWTQTIIPAEITLEAGDIVNDADFENFEHGSVSGYKWNDINGDFQKSENEPKLEGWEITLQKKNAEGAWEVFATTDTDSNGDYSFEGLTLLETDNGQNNSTYSVPEYRVCEEDRSPTWQQTFPTSEDGCHEFTITTSGQLVEDLNFGNQGRGTLTVKKSTVTVDTSADASFTFGIESLDADDVIDDIDIDTVGAETVAASSVDVAAGEYRITETDIESGWSFTQVSCNNDEQYWTTGVEQVSVKVNPGEDVTCTFVNTRDTGTIEVRKEVISSSENGLFDLLVNGNVEAEDVADGGTTGAIALSTGTHSVSELAGTDTSLADYHTTYLCTRDGDEFTTGIGTVVSDIAVATDEAVVCTFTNTRYAEIIIEKEAVTVDESSTQEFEFDASWTETNFSLGSGGQELSAGLLPNTYTVSEVNIPDGWDLTEIDCGDAQTTIIGVLPNTVSVTISAGETVTCKFVNTQRGTITVEKAIITADEAVDQDFEFTSETELLNGTINNNGGFSSGANSLVPGTYTINEEPVDGWELVGISCQSSTNENGLIHGLLEESPLDSSTASVELQPGEDVTCTFVNQELATVNITKFNDFNGNGVWDSEIEPSLPDWEMTLACDPVQENGNGVSLAIAEVREEVRFFPPQYCASDAESEFELPQTIIDNQFTNITGVAMFTDLLAGPYTFGEVNQAGWEQTGSYCEIDSEIVSAEQISVYPGQTRECFIGNAQDLVLNLEKENDTPEVTTVGDNVTYTLTVSVPEESGVSYNTTVVDVPPENFLVDNTTTTSALISSPNRPGSEAFVGGGTTYASPGTWNLGTLYPGDVVVLTYQAEIQENVSPGTYPDIAYARGGTVPELEENETVYSNVHLASAEDPFVGTDVTVAVDRPQVLGVQTLARTGAPIIWHYAVIPILLIGLAISLVRREMKGAL
jgi:hypothetical protein